MLEEMALSYMEAESSTLKHLERGNHSDCDSDNDSENKMTSVALQENMQENTMTATRQWSLRRPLATAVSREMIERFGSWLRERLSTLSPIPDDLAGEAEAAELTFTRASGDSDGTPPTPDAPEATPARSGRSNDGAA